VIWLASRVHLKNIEEAAHLHGFCGSQSTMPIHSYERLIATARFNLLAVAININFAQTAKYFYLMF
jgi:hypothetical protein